MSNQDHIEVAPRMWDYTIAATSTPKETSGADELTSTTNKQTPSMAVVNEPIAVDNVNPSGWLVRLKTYLIPIAFILGVIIVVYVLWKYFTKYKNKKHNDALNAAHLSDDDDKPSDPNDPAHIIEHEDMSKFEYESDEEEEKPQPRFNQRFETIEEETSDDESESSSSDQEEESNDESDQESNDSDQDDSEENESEEDDQPDIEMPNLADIERMIEENTDVTPESDMFSLKNAYVSPPEIDTAPTNKNTSSAMSKSSKSRKMKRVTL